MQKHPWDDIQNVIKNAAPDYTGIIFGGTLSVEGIYNFAPVLWLDFINGDAQNSNSMWPVYREFARAVDDLRNWLTEEGYEYNQGMKEMALLSKDQFIEEYPKLQADAVKLQASMRDVIDHESQEAISKVMIQDIFAKGIHLPSVLSTVNITREDMTPTYQVRMNIPEADHPNFWLTVILGGMLSSYRDGQIPRLCAAPDCNRYFLASPRRRDQRYHSQTCQNRHYMQIRRSQL